METNCRRNEQQLSSTTIKKKWKEYFWEKLYGCDGHELKITPPKYDYWGFIPPNEEKALNWDQTFKFKI